MTTLPIKIEQKHAPWLNYLRRSFIDSGEMGQMIVDGICGLTVNLSVLAQAVTCSADYDRALELLIAEGVPFDVLPRALLTDDIQRAATILNPVYERSQRLNGYISLPIDPALAHDTVGTVATVRHLLADINYPNVMVEIPATPGGIAAIKELTRDGVCTNATLIFTLETYEAVAQAYLEGLAEYMDSHSVWRRWPTAVATIAIGPLDGLVDSWLMEQRLTDRQGEAGVALARLVYESHRSLLGGSQWQKLSKKGGLPQRPLWADLVPRNFQLPDDYYLNAMAAPGTVSSLEPVLWNTIRDSSRSLQTQVQGSQEARTHLQTLTRLGLDLAATERQLQAEGLARLGQAFKMVRQSVRQKREQLEDDWRRMTWHLGEGETAVTQQLTQLCNNRIMCRIWNHDHTVWQTSPDQIGRQLGWLHLMPVMRDHIKRLQTMTQTLVKEGYTHALLLGMGGSGLAPQLFAYTFTQAALPPRPGLPPPPQLHLDVLVNADPVTILNQAKRIDPARTLFVVVSKSGRTVETMAAFNYFYNRVQTAVGTAEAGRHFVAVTDPDSPLVALASDLYFRDTFYNPLHIPGRYAALTFTGLIPAALAGVNLETLLDRAQGMACNGQSCNCPLEGDNVAAQLGTALGTLAQAGRDKLTFITNPVLAGFADWVEQLLAESLGKDGCGIVPVVGEPLGEPAVYGRDRAFVHLRLDGDDSQDTAVQNLIDAGFPVIILHWRDLQDVGGQFFLWQMATAVAAHHLSVNPFSQPQFDAYKSEIQRIVTDAQENGEIFVPDDDLTTGTWAALQKFLAQAHPGDYVAVQAFTPRTSTIDHALQSLRAAVRDQTGLATIVGYGPRCLHTTGQMLLSDRGNGLVIQLLANVVLDVLIPDKVGEKAAGLTFGTLKELQALTMSHLLRHDRRRVLRCHLGADAAIGLQSLVDESVAEPVKP